MIPLFKPVFTDEMLDAATRALQHEKFLRGESVTALEEEFANYVGSRFAIAVNSGTSALVIGLQSLGISSGDIVATTPASFIATANAILMRGATPLFIDIDPKTLTIDPELLARACEEYSIDAILPVHLYGQSANLKKIQEVASEHSIPILDDCAQAAGAEFEGKKIGGSTDVSAFSLYTTKNFSVCGDGGIITTDDPAIYRRCTELRDIGIKDDWDEIGYTARLHSALAAIGRVQLRYLDHWNQKRRNLGKLYRSLLKDLDSIKLPEESIFHLYAIGVKEGARNFLQSWLLKRRVQTKIHYPFPLHLQGHIRKHCIKFDSLHESEKWAQETLSLPMYPDLSRDEVEFVSSQIHSFFR